MGRSILRTLRHFVALLCMVSLTSAASADVGGEMDNFFRGMGSQANVTGPGAFQGQQAGYYSLGNIYVRNPQKTIQPFDLQLPHARAGCGGIDLFAGSFSFINAHELVAMMKAVANNALSFAFQLAIDSVSPQISKTITDISQKLQQVNQMNISSCEVAQGLVSRLWPSNDSNRKTICESIGNSQGIFGDWASARQGCNNGGQEQSTIDQNSDPNMKALIAGQPINYTWSVINNDGWLKNTDQAFRELVMTIVGTIIVTKATDGTSGPHYQWHGSADAAVLGALIDGTQSGAQPQVLQCDEATQCLSPTMVPLSINQSVAFRPRIKTLLQQMQQNITTDTAMTDDQKSLLNMVSLPLYKILAVQAAAHVSLNDGDLDNLAEVSATEILNNFLDVVVQKVSANNNSLTNADAVSAGQWTTQINNVRTHFDQLEVKNNSRIQSTMAFVNKSIYLESTLQNSMSPQMQASLMFSRGLNAHGLR